MYNYLLSLFHYRLFISSPSFPSHLFLAVLSFSTLLFKSPFTIILLCSISFTFSWIWMIQFMSNIFQILLFYQCHWKNNTIPTINWRLWKYNQLYSRIGQVISKTYEIWRYKSNSRWSLWIYEGRIVIACKMYIVPVYITFI